MNLQIRGNLKPLTGHNAEAYVDVMNLLALRLGLLSRPTARTRVRATAYRAFRAPTLNELYRPFQVGTVLTAANEALDAEQLLGADVGVEGLVGEAGAVRLTGFWNVLEDPIVNVTLLIDRRYLVGRAGVDTVGPPFVIRGGLRYR